MVTDVTKKYRDYFAYGLVVVAGLYLIGAMSLLFKSTGNAGFANKSAVVGTLFAAAVPVLSLVLAVALVTRFGEPTQHARVVVLVALAIGALDMLFGIVTFFAQFGAEIGLGYAGIAFAGKIVGTLIGLAQLLLLGLAWAFFLTTYLSLPAPERASAQAWPGQYAGQYGQSGQQPGQYSGQYPGQYAGQYAGQSVGQQAGPYASGYPGHPQGQQPGYGGYPGAPAGGWAQQPPSQPAQGQQAQGQQPGPGYPAEGWPPAAPAAGASAGPYPGGGYSQSAPQPAPQREPQPEPQPEPMYWSQAPEPRADTPTASEPATDPEPAVQAEPPAQPFEPEQTGEPEQPFEPEQPSQAESAGLDGEVAADESSQGSEESTDPAGEESRPDSRGWWQGS